MSPRELKIMSNVGELTHRFVRVKNGDIVFMFETFLESHIPVSYAWTKGYSLGQVINSKK